MSGRVVRGEPLVPALLLALLACAAALESSSPAATPSSQCNLSWAAPETLLAAEGAPVHVEQATSAARLGGSLVLFGSPTWFWPRAGSPPPTAEDRLASRAAGVLVTRDGAVTGIAKPAQMARTSGFWTHPSRDGGLHVVWGQPADGGTAPFREVPVVLYSHFDGEGWSEPETVMSGATVNWLWYSSAALMGDDVLVAAPARDAGWSGIIVARRSSAGWQSERLSGSGDFPPNSVTIVADAERALLFYPGYGAENKVGTAAIHLRTLKRGMGWSASRLMQPLARGNFWPELAAVRAGNGTFHLLWNYRISGESSDAIYHTSSRDLIDWTEPDRLSVGGALLDFRVAAEGPDAVRLVARTDQHGGLATGVWRETAPDSFNEITFATAATPPSLSAVARDTLVLNWGSILVRQHGATSRSVGIGTLISRGICSRQ